MASGFIEITDKKSFAPRWTGFDEVIKILIRELNNNSDKNTSELIKHLESIIPPENFNEELEMGWGFIDERIDGTTSRVLELKKMTTENLELFWEAVKNGYDNLIKFGTEYSTLYPELMKELLEMKE
ncbi:hypothetical protein J8L88_16795 [Aquimarina sp. MMG015]|uniref:hypothetical protein n=1 Tax=Aquimarina TaxID=290174 RepID=UPI0004191BEE|nr:MULTISPECIES: hypothetical protein [Aquimarina]MBQ4804521.1 hypothetical protein [Aquimarina sp. MMG015]